MKRYAVGFMAIVAIVLLSTVPTPSQASAVLAFDVGNNGSYDLVVADNSPDDTNPADGIITFTQTIGTIFFDIQTGITKPQLGSAAFPQMDLNSVIMSNNLDIVVKIVFADEGFNFDGGLAAGIGGTTAGSVSAAVQTGDPLVDLINLGLFGPVAFSASATGAATLSPSDVLAMSTIVTQSGANAITSYDFVVQPVPEPGTMMLLGSGLVGLAGWGRKKFRK